MYLHIKMLFVSMWISIDSIDIINYYEYYLPTTPFRHMSFTVFLVIVNCAWSCGRKKSCERQGDPKYAPPNNGSPVGQIFNVFFSKKNTKTTLW